MQEKLIEYISQYIDLSAEEQESLLSVDIIRSYKKGDVLLKQGDISTDGYFVLQGCLRVYYMINGEEKTTDFYTEMQGLTPLCASNGKPSEYYVSCVEDCILTVGNQNLEEQMYAKFPKMEKVCRIISEKLLSDNKSAFNEFKTSTPETRYLNLRDSNPELLQRVPQTMLASYLGITPQSLSRLRKRLSQK